MITAAIEKTLAIAAGTTVVMINDGRKSVDLLVELLADVEVEGWRVTNPDSPLEGMWIYQKGGKTYACPGGLATPLDREETDCQVCGDPNAHDDWELCEGRLCVDCAEKQNRGRRVPQEWIIED